MPLSKARDKARKKRERAKSRLEKPLCPPQTSKPVQPKPIEPLTFDGCEHIIFDADGNPIYEEG